MRAVRRKIDLNELLRTAPNDLGCDASARFFEHVAEAIMSGVPPERLFPQVLAHLRLCAACREDLAGLVDAIRTFGDPGPPGPTPTPQS
jgi:hypothetical protein